MTYESWATAYRSILATVEEEMVGAEGATIFVEYRRRVQLWKWERGIK